MTKTRSVSRTGLLAVLASLVLASAAGAADRMSPDAMAVPTTIEGLVSSVAPPVVKLADGLIAIDASTATVSLPTGKPGTLADVKAGSRIVAVLKAGRSSGPRVSVPGGIEYKLKSNRSLSSVEAGRPIQRAPPLLARVMLGAGAR